MAEKAIMWVNAAWKAFSGFPTRVQENVIDAFTTIRSGGLPVHAKPMHGLDGGVFEIAIRHRKDAWRVVYAIKIGEQIWIIHAFQKKSKSGSTTPREEIETIRQRVKQLKQELSSKKR